MAWAVAAGATIGGGLGLIGSKRNIDKATDVSLEQAQMLDQRERERFEEAKVQAEKLRQAGDEAAAVALEEAAKAEMGAQKFEALSNYYAQNADAQAALRQRMAENIYGRTKDATIARADAGQGAKAAIQAASGGLMDEARSTDARMMGALTEGRGFLEQGRRDIDAGMAGVNDARDRGTAYLDTAFGNISDRFQPFMDSERMARGQLDVEAGLAPGDPNRGYRSTGGYSAMMDASRIAEQEGLQTIDQAAGNSGALYSGSRGAALADRTRQGSWERAGVEQAYYQNYMNLLAQMANPTSTNAVAGYEAATAGNKATLGTNAAALGLDAAGRKADLSGRSADMGMNAAGYISDAYMNAAGTGVNAEIAAQGMGLDTMRTGMEGADLLQYVDPGDGGARYTLGGFDPGTAGSPYRMSAADTRLNTTGNAAGLITGNMPTGVNSANIATNAANNAAQGKNAMLADIIGAGTNLYSSYLMGPQPSYPVAPNSSYAGGNTNPTYPYMA